MDASIVVCGAAGRMGRMILRCAHDGKETGIAGGVEVKGSPFVGARIADLIGESDAEGLVVDSMQLLPLKGGEVVIDFTTPEATMGHLAFCRQREIPMVIGTTGLNAEQKKTLQDVAREIPIVFAPNMSIGVNALFKIVGEVTRILGEQYDVEIVETHHRYKKDAPSGTARRLGEVVAEAMSASYEDLVVNGREGISGERPARQIGMHALRGGDVVGEHTVRFLALGETVEISHRAHSRETFARGAVRAAGWIAGKKSGLYDMQDVLGLR